jgi:RNA exonuclease 1
MHWVVRGTLSLFSLLSVTSPNLELTRFDPFPFPLSGVTPKANADGGIGPENPEASRNNAVPTENTNHTGAADTPQMPPTAASPDQNENNNALLSAVSNLNAQLTALHAALPPRTAFLLVSGHSDPRGMSALAARRAQYQASQNQNQNHGTATSTGTDTTGTDVSAPLRWSTADDRALEEAVVRARMGLLFVGVKS